jgi:hypothetical protein
MIRKLKSGEYRIYSRRKDAKSGKRKNLGAFSSRGAAEKQERAVQFLSGTKRVRGANAVVESRFSFDFALRLVRSGQALA